MAGSPVVNTRSRYGHLSALPRRPQRTGIASMLAMIYLILIAVLTVGFVESTTMSAQVAKNERGNELARAAADSGMQFMRYQLGSVTLPYGTTQANLLSTVANSLASNLNGTANMNGSTVAITSGPSGPTIFIPSASGWTTLDSQMQTRFQANIVQNGNSLIVTVHGAGTVTKMVRGIQLQYQAAPYSLIGLNSIALSTNAFTDSYDASKGAYVQSKAHHAGSIASNGNITLSGASVVDGDARCGVGKTTTLRNTAKVTGLNAPLSHSTPNYPSVTLPPTYTNLGDVNMSSGTVSLAGGTYLINHLTLSGTAVINWQGPTKLYIQSSYNVSGGAQINTYQNVPANRTLYFLPTCTTATWQGTNVCVGELYAPNTDFTISGNVELMGRITAHSITNSSSGGMHADESMSPAGIGGFIAVPGTYIEVP